MSPAVLSVMSSLFCRTPVVVTSPQMRQNPRVPEVENRQAVIHPPLDLHKGFR